jgi:hypothetical protein
MKGDDMKDLRQVAMAKPGFARRSRNSGSDGNPPWVSISTNCLLVLAAGVLGSLSCDNGETNNGPSVNKVDAAAKSDVGQVGGSRSGGASGSGGTAGAGSSSAKGGAAGGGASGNAGSSAGGRDGSGGTAGSGGGQKPTGGAAGAGSTNNGGAAGTGVGGSATGGSANGGAGGQNTGAGRDASSDLVAADGRAADRPVDQAARDVSGRTDGRGPDSACPANQSLCNGTCVDITMSSNNCGECGKECLAGQVCSGSSCMGTTPTDGCTSTVVSDLTLKQIAVYQTVMIPVMKDGAEVAAASRNASVVQGKQALVRVFVTPGSSWSAREVAGRLTVASSGAEGVVYSSKKTISAASTDADQNSTFQFTIPAASMVAPLSYSVEVVECGSQSGSGGQARFPANGTIDLGVKTTGVLKVKLIPMKVGTIVPDTSDTALAPYKAELVAMYPISQIDFTVGDTLTVSSPVDWSSTLDQLRSKRSTDKPANDVYYFGLIKPADTLRAYCQSTCTTGIGYVVTSTSGSMAGSSRVAMGIAYADKTSAETMAHELGHNHGLSHAPCSTAGTISGVDPKYPYSNAIIGVWGYDSRTQLLYDPSKYKDIMSYCSNQWISDYNYKPIITRVAAVNGVANVLTVSAAIAKWRIILLDDEHGPRWGIPLDQPAPAEGDLEMATIYDGSGGLLTTVPVYRTEISDISAASYMVPEPQEGWYAIAVGDSTPLPFSAPMPRLQQR